MQRRVVVFDFDGTLSLIRSGWLQIMTAMFLNELEPLHHTRSGEDLRRHILDTIFELTGKDTIWQMVALADDVRAAGGTPKHPAAYKAAFLDQLLELVKQRLARLRSGDLEPDSMLVPGSRALLEELAGRGIALYLASGTDEANLKEEAQAVDIARYFGDRVYGARNDGGGFTKAALVRFLLSQGGFAPSELAAVGDGPVEIREFSQAGCLAIGAATDEPECRRVDPEKRTHLLRAGAAAIVPNYSALPELLAFLLGGAREEQAALR